jgi:hypothetical protein
MNGSIDQKHLLPFIQPNWAIQLELRGIRGLVNHATKKMYRETTKRQFAAVPIYWALKGC